MEAFRRFHAGLTAVFFALAACATSKPVVVEPSEPLPEYHLPVLRGPDPNAPVAQLPAWPGDNADAGLIGLMESCRAWAGKPDDAPVSRRADYAGSVGEWREVCDAVEDLPAAGPSATFARLEQLLVPLEIAPDGDTRFTGYFEPEIEARSRPIPPFTEPVPGVPSDLEAETSTKVWQRLSNGKRRAYPPRAEIDLNRLPVLGYAHPADVFFMQIQGSGRLRFEDGRVVRAAFAAHNAQPFRSTANWLLQQGEIRRGEADMQGIRAWMDRASPARVRQAMNANPRFVFFRELPVENPIAGPVGAMGIPLTAWGSVAVDPVFHPYGVPMYIETNLPRPGTSSAEVQPFRGMLVAQDTGGAIKGAVRGDIFFGTGPGAGEIAGRMNAQGRMWVLLPRSVAARLYQQDMGSAGARP